LGNEFSTDEDKAKSNIRKRYNYQELLSYLPDLTEIERRYIRGKQLMIEERYDEALEILHDVLEIDTEIVSSDISSYASRSTEIHPKAMRSTEATARFKFDLAEDVEAVASNLFDGTIMQTAIDASGAKVYLLINYNKEAFYWMADEYNANCGLVGAGAGYVKNDANRAYLKLLQGASSYGFRYEGTTGVEDVKTENGEVKAIYDLQGRKVVNPKEGLYIVDGKKVFIK
jgi:hypothetical protein